MVMVATNVFHAEKATSMVYHSTMVAKFYHETGEVVLDHGCWMTATTKKRMNQFAEMNELSFRVYQEDFAWYVWFPGEERATIPFEDRKISFKLWE